MLCEVAGRAMLRGRARKAKQACDLEPTSHYRTTTSLDRHANITCFPKHRCHQMHGAVQLRSMRPLSCKPCTCKLLEYAQLAIITRKLSAHLTELGSIG